jgi:hypothetical protein
VGPLVRYLFFLVLHQTERKREKEKQGKRGAALAAWRSRRRWLGAAPEMERRLAVDGSGVRATAGGSERI